MSEPDELVSMYLAAKAEYEYAKTKYDDLTEALTKQMVADQRKSYRWSDGDLVHKLTFVQQHTTYIDEPGLRKALTAKVYDRYTKRTLDRRAMELAMDTGDVDPILVARFVTTRPKKPFLSYNEREITE
jgi:hypothetical protein